MSRIKERFKDEYRRLSFDKKAEIRDLFIKMIEAEGFRVRSIDGLVVDWVATSENKRVMKLREVKDFLKKHKNYDIRGFPTNLPLRLQTIIEGKASVRANRIEAKVTKQWLKENGSL